MESQQELMELQKEWRREVSESLRELRRQQTEIADLLAKVRQEFVQVHEWQKLADRLVSLETDRVRLITGAVVLQVTGSGVLWLLLKLWGHP